MARMLGEAAQVRGAQARMPKGEAQAEDEEHKQKRKCTRWKRVCGSHRENPQPDSEKDGV